MSVIYRIFTGSNIKFYVGLFNSLFFKFSFSNWYAGGGLGEKGIRFKSEFMKDYPIPSISNENSGTIGEIEDLVDRIILIKKEEGDVHDTQFIEKQIDQLVYKLYELTPDEIELIEKTIN